MATATSPSAKKPPLSNRQKLLFVLVAFLALALLWLMFNFASIKAEAKAGAAYGAHVGCSCRYVEGRSLGSCESDFEDGMALVSISDDDANKRVTASVPFLAHAVAERRGAFGCVQLNEKEIEALD
ncbi:MAG: hypothetical protein IPP23_04840 [Sphingomonadales bacterium]|nr:hypothetical protein [Sphingomonadales bacterium]